jgi:hypothetical protein
MAKPSLWNLLFVLPKPPNWHITLLPFHHKHAVLPCIVTYYTVPKRPSAWTGLVETKGRTEHTAQYSRTCVE